MTPEKPQARLESADYLYWWLSPVLLLVLGAFCWSNHFDSGFHRDDFPNIVNNRSIRNSEIGNLLTSPAAFSQDSGHADFRPLLALLFWVDSSIRHDGGSSIFQMSSFFWFLPLPFLIYALVRLIPGALHQTALFTAILFAVHPIVSDTLNYISRRGELIAAGAVTAATVIWVLWPLRMPPTLGIDLYSIPKTWTEEWLFNNGAALEARYKKLKAGPEWLYFLPLFIGVLCSPAAAAFGFVVVAWLWVYPTNDPNPNDATATGPITVSRRRLYAPLIASASWLVFHTAVTWSYLAPLRAPALQYWLGQPRVAVQYFIWFFTPFQMSADAGLLPELRFWPPDILVGIAGTAVIIAIAAFTRRREEWRPVSFGLAWFLAAQVPFAVVPQVAADSGARMFIPSIGLAIAVGHIIMWAVRKAQELPKFAFPAAFALSMASFFLLAGMGWMTYDRNTVWLNDRTLWEDTAKRSPGNQRALINYAWEMIRYEDMTTAEAYATRADKAAPQDAQSEVLVADALDRLGSDARAEFHYSRAVVTWPRYSSAMSAYGKWLLARQRYAEATDWSVKALRINQRDNVARVNLIDAHSAAFEWDSVHKLAEEALAVDPDNARAKLAIITSEDALNRVSRAEKGAEGGATFNDYLTLSVAYFRAKRYEDCITAARRAVELSPELAEAHANISACQHSLGRDEEAIAELREVVRLRPDMRVAWSNLAFLEDELRKKRTQVK